MKSKKGLKIASPGIFWDHSKKRAKNSVKNYKKGKTRKQINILEKPFQSHF